MVTVELKKIMAHKTKTVKTNGNDYNHSNGYTHCILVLELLAVAFILCQMCIFCPFHYTNHLPDQGQILFYQQTASDRV